MSRRDQSERKLKRARLLRNRRNRTIATLGCVVVLVTAIALMIPAITMTKGNLTCGMDEHQHVGTCYEKVLVCDKDETDGHVHGDECYENRLICDIPEHTHTDACYDHKDTTLQESSDSGPSIIYLDDDDLIKSSDAASGAQPDAGKSASDDASGSSAAVKIPDDPSEKTELAEDESDTSDDGGMPKQSFEGELRDGDDNIVMTVSVDAPKGAFPEGATMRVEAVDDSEIEQAVDTAVSESTTGKMTDYQAVDIAFYDADGAEIEPATKITVKIASSRIADSQGAVVVHVDDEGAGNVIRQLTGAELLKRNQEAAEDELCFDADEFSVYAVAYTVDFHYGIDGNAYDFSMLGGDAICLSDLVKSLHIAVDDPNTENDEVWEFVGNVDSVEFSDESLLSVIRAETDTTVGDLKEDQSLESNYSHELSQDDRAAIDAKTVYATDWALISLDSFETLEQLTVTMKDGEQFVVRVSDALVKTYVLSADGIGYWISIEYGDDAGIPEGAKLTAREIEEGTAEYNDYLASSIDALTTEGGTGDISFARFFDIQITKDGETIEPQAPVKVSISYPDGLDVPEDAALDVVHFADAGTEVISDVALDDQATGISYEQASFSVAGTIISGNPTGSSSQHGQYMVLVKRDDQYFIVLNDGRLQPMTNSGDDVQADFPMIWTYDGHCFYHEAEAVDYNGALIAEDYFYRYIDPNSQTGLSMEDSTNTDTSNTRESWGKWSHYVLEGSRKLQQSPSDSAISAWLNYADHKVSSARDGASYLGVAEDDDGLKLCGQVSADDAAEVYFARVTSNTASNSSLRLGSNYNTVDHIDIAVEGRAGLNFPLAYGTYYYLENGEVKTLYVSKENPMTLSLPAQRVAIDKDDIKKADIIAYTKNADGTHTPVPNAFYVTGYSANNHDDTNSEQVRIAGVFKVDTLEDYSGWGNSNDNENYRHRRLDNRVYYAISTTKEITFDLKYNGMQLYESEDDALAQDPEKKLTAPANVTLSASFDYWDKRNECPGVYGNASGWSDGMIFGEEGQFGNSGMDFSLGTSSDGSSGTVAIEITKYLMDDNGSLITPSHHVHNTFHVYRKNLENNGDEVKGVDVGAYDAAAQQPAYTEYTYLHDKTITIGKGGMGEVFDYDVSPGMLYIEEDKASVDDEIVDNRGIVWKYKKTHLETEYVWRDDGYPDDSRHFSKDYSSEAEAYNSIPDLLGNYKDINGIDRYNGFLEFYVYNIYEREPIDVTVQKAWKHENGTAAQPQDGASISVRLKRFKLVEDEDNPVTGSLKITQSLSGPDEGQQGFHATYKVMQGDSVVKKGSYDPDTHETTITGLPGGDYTVVIESGSSGYDVVNSPTTQNVTIVNGQTTTTGFASTMTKHEVRTVTVHVTNSIDGASNYQNLEYTFPSSARIVMDITRPGPSQNNSFHVRINNGAISYNPPSGTGFASVNQQLYFDLPESGEYNINIWHDWGPADLWINSVTIVPAATSGTMSTFSMARMMSPRINALRGTNVIASATPPASKVPGMKYVVDDQWSTDSDPVIVTLTDSPWKDTVEDLPASDNLGNEYLYFIASVEEEGVSDDTRVVLGEGADGVPITTDDETVLPVTNYVPNEPPVVSIKKVDANGFPLTGATFTLAKDGGEPQMIEVNASNGLYSTEGLESGSYVLEETAAPSGFKKVEGQIAFTVTDDYFVQFGDLPEGVTLDEETLTFTFKDEFDTQPGSLTVVKRWQDFIGNAAEAGSDNVQVQLKRSHDVHVHKRLHIVINAPNNAHKEITVDATNDVAHVVWDDGGQFDWDSRRLTHSETSGLRLTDGCPHNDSGGTQATWDIAGISSVSEETAEVVFTYVAPSNTDEILNTWFRDRINNTTINVTWSGNAIQSGAQTENVGNPETLNTGNGWSHAWDNLPAVDGQGNAYTYYVEEVGVPTGYQLTTANNVNGNQGTVALYNRKTTADLTVVKIDKDDHATKLEGVEFKLRKLDESTAGVHYVASGNVPAEGVTKTTDNAGTIMFDGLQPGIYEVLELKAPDGYLLPADGAFYVRISAEGTTLLDKDDAKAPSQWSAGQGNGMVDMVGLTATVSNEAGEQLPVTGGPGTVAFVIVGITIMVSGTYMLARKRRRCSAR